MLQKIVISCFFVEKLSFLLYVQPKLKIFMHPKAPFPTVSARIINDLKTGIKKKDKNVLLRIIPFYLNNMLSIYRTLHFLSTHRVIVVCTLECSFDHIDRVGHRGGSEPVERLPGNNSVVWRFL